VKNVAFGIIDGLNRRGRPRREWMDSRANTQHHRAEPFGVETRHWIPTGSSPWIEDEEKEELFQNKFI